jgi:hypothetical protein
MRALYLQIISSDETKKTIKLQPKYSSTLVRREKLRELPPEPTDNLIQLCVMMTKLFYH